jgi:hypothetical protein
MGCAVSSDKKKRSKNKKIRHMKKVIEKELSPKKNNPFEFPQSNDICLIITDTNCNSNSYDSRCNKKNEHRFSNTTSYSKILELSAENSKE